MDGERESSEEEGQEKDDDEMVFCPTRKEWIRRDDLEKLFESNFMDAEADEDC